MTIRGNGWRVLAPPSIAIPKVLALFFTLTSVDMGSSSPGWQGECGEREKSSSYNLRTSFKHIYKTCFHEIAHPFITLQSAFLILILNCYKNLLNTQQTNSRFVNGLNLSPLDSWEKYVRFGCQKCHCSSYSITFCLLIGSGQALHQGFIRVFVRSYKHRLNIIDSGFTMIKIHNYFLI